MALPYRKTSCCDWPSSSRDCCTIATCWKLLSLNFCQNVCGTSAPDPKTRPNHIASPLNQIRTTSEPCPNHVRTASEPMAEIKGKVALASQRYDGYVGRISTTRNAERICTAMMQATSSNLSVALPGSWFLLWKDSKSLRMIGLCEGKVAGDL